MFWLHIALLLGCRLIEFELAFLHADYLQRTFIVHGRSTPEANSVFSHYGPQLTEILIAYIGGDAARSELGHICEPLQALLKNDARSRPWIEAALNSSSFPS